MLRLRSRYHLKRRRLGFARNASGSTAVEFALVAPVFLMMMFSIFEVGWFYFANSVVDAAITDMARLVKTGQVQGWDGTDEEKYDKLYDDVCEVFIRRSTRRSASTSPNQERTSAGSFPP